MNSNNLLQIVQKGFHVTLGATASLVETLQDTQQREQRLAELRLELNQRVQEWAAKGEITEQEARNFVETMIAKPPVPPTTAETPSDTVYSTPPSAAPTDVQLELQELTAQIATIRAELEKLRNPNSEL